MNFNTWILNSVNWCEDDYIFKRKLFIDDLHSNCFMDIKKLIVALKMEVLLLKRSFLKVLELNLFKMGLFEDVHGWEALLRTISQRWNLAQLYLA